MKTVIFSSLVILGLSYGIYINIVKAGIKAVKSWENNTVFNLK